MYGSESAGPWSRVFAGTVAAILVAGCSDSSAPTESVDGLRLEALTATSLTGTVGTDVSPAPTVRATNRAGAPVPGISISFEVTGGGGLFRTALRTNAEGTATVSAWRLGGTSGPQTVTARSGDLAVVFTAMAEPGAPEVTRISGNNQIGLTGAPLPQPLHVRVADRFGNPSRGAPVTFAVMSGGGTMGGGTAITDSNGFATSGVWTLGSAAGAQQVRAEMPGASEVFFTAVACDDPCQAQELAFEHSGRIFTTLVTGRGILGGGARLLVDGGAYRPAWSPDGLRMAFVRPGLGSRPSIYLMDADGSNVVLRADGFDSPAWSPDGRWLAVDTGFCVYHCEVFLLRVDEEGQAPVYLAGMAAQPAWSPDGKKLAFVSLSGDDGYHALHTMNVDGSEVREITVRDPGAISSPTWSPDGRRIAFEKCIGGLCNIFVVNADGGAAVLLTTERIAAEPAWSPDGTWIAFAVKSVWNVSDDAIAIVPADATHGESIPAVSAGSSPAWRPSASAGALILAAARTRPPRHPR
jgi:hypothetical protein